VLHTSGHFSCAPGPAVAPDPLQSDFCPAAAGFVLRGVQRRQAHCKLEVVGAKGEARSLASSQNRDVELADIASSQAATLDVNGAYGTAALRKGRAKLMRRKALLGALVGAVLVLAVGCTSSTQEKASTQEHKASTQKKASTQEHKAYSPHINPSEFTTTIDNEYFPMKPGTTFLYQGAKSAPR
jgi:cell division protein FtsL